MFETVNPATEKGIKKYPSASVGELQAALDRSARLGFPHWSQLSIQERCVYLKKIANLLQQKKETLALEITQEMGKPVTQAESEIQKCAWVCDYYAEHGEQLLQPQEVDAGRRKSFICFEPLGPVLAIMPWNFPYWQVFRFAVPALVAGNTILLKHAPNTMGCAIRIESLFKEAGFPPEVFQNLLARHEDIPRLFSGPEVQAVTFTGSERAGRIVGGLAGANLKKSVLELGGSDAYVVFEDADLELAARVCATARLLNAGQSCVAAKRFIVLEPVYKKFLSLFVPQMALKKCEDPSHRTSELGPLARQDLRQALVDQVKQSVAQGAELVLGGEIPKQEGYFYPSTVLAEVTPGMRVFDEEVFGPVAAVIRASSEEQALRLANQHRYGLGAALFSQNEKRLEALARNEIQAGVCALNTQVVSDPRLPFGGVKASGYGRELSRFGLLEFVNVKTVMTA